MQYVRIRNLREDMDLTQTDMAKKLFISQRTYSYYESGGHATQLPAFIIKRLPVRFTCWNEPTREN